MVVVEVVEVEEEVVGAAARLRAAHVELDELAAEQRAVALRPTRRHLRWWEVEGEVVMAVVVVAAGLGAEAAAAATRRHLRLDESLLLHGKLLTEGLLLPLEALERLRLLPELDPQLGAAGALGAQQLGEAVDLALEIFALRLLRPEGDGGDVRDAGAAGGAGWRVWGDGGGGVTCARRSCCAPSACWSDEVISRLSSTRVVSSDAS